MARPMESSTIRPRISIDVQPEVRRFVFSDEAGRKLRPAVVISSSAYHRARQEIVVAAGIIRTIKRTMIERKLGSLGKPDLEAVERELRRCLGL